MADVVHVSAPDFTHAATTVAQHIETAAVPPRSAAPPPMAASPVDVAASGAAGAIQTKIDTLSTQLAPSGPAIRQAGATAAASLLAQDATNAAHMPSAPSVPASTGISAVAAAARAGSGAAAPAASMTGSAAEPATTTGGAAKATIHSGAYASPQPPTPVTTSDAPRARLPNTGADLAHDMNPPQPTHAPAPTPPNSPAVSPPPPPSLPVPSAGSSGGAAGSGAQTLSSGPGILPQAPLVPRLPDLRPPSGDAKKIMPFKEDNPGGVVLPTNPYPPGTVKHDEVEETDRKLLEYGTKLAAYNLMDPPTNEAEYEEQYDKYLELNADLAEIVLEYKQEGVEVVVDHPSAPTRPG